MARWSAFKWVHHTPLYCYWATVGHRRPPFYLALNRASHRSNIVGPPSRKGVLWVAGTQQTRSQSIGVNTEQLHGFRPLYANKHPKDNVLQNYLSGIPPPPPPVKVEGRDSSFSPPNIDCWGEGEGESLTGTVLERKRKALKVVLQNVVFWKHIQKKGPGLRNQRALVRVASLSPEQSIT